MSTPTVAPARSCAPWQEALSASVDGETDDLEEHRLRAHLRRCPRCATAHVTLLDLRAATLAGGAHAPPGLGAEIARRRDARHARRRVGAAAAIVLALLLTVGATTDLGGRGEGGDELAAGPARDARVELLDDVASTDVVEVEAGSAVTWANVGSTTHRLVSDVATATVTDEVRPGKSETITYARAGTYAFHCSIHPTVRGRVEVTS